MINYIFSKQKTYSRHQGVSTRYHLISIFRLAEYHLLSTNAGNVADYSMFTCAARGRLQSLATRTRTNRSLSVHASRLLLPVIAFKL